MGIPVKNRRVSPAFMKKLSEKFEEREDYTLFKFHDRDFVERILIAAQEVIAGEETEE